MEEERQKSQRKQRLGGFHEISSRIKNKRTGEVSLESVGGIK